MANKCETTINQCIKANCVNPLFAGVAPESIILNKDQIKSIDFDGSLVTGITMDTIGTSQDTYCGYVCQQLGNRPYDGSQTEMVEGTYGNKFNHTITLAVPDNGPSITENVIDAFANGRFVTILKSDYVHKTDADYGTTAGDNEYSVYGAHKGLRASSIQRELYGDNESFWIVTLVEENSPKSGMFLSIGTNGADNANFLEELKCTDCYPA